MAVLEGKRGRRNAGFTLIELTVVIVIIGLLIAVAIPTLLGSRTRASDAAAKSLATQGLKTQKVAFTDAQSFTADDALLEALEPSVDFEAWPPSGPMVKGKVYVRDASGHVVVLVSKSASGSCFWTKDVDGRTLYLENDCTDPAPDAPFSPQPW